MQVAVGLQRSFWSRVYFLSLIGGAVGLLLASWGVRMLVAYGPTDVPRLQDVGLDGSVLAFTFGASILTGILFGLFPSLARVKTKSQQHAQGQRSWSNPNRTQPYA